jgi:hydrogenase expression/formation protein HypE
VPPGRRRAALGELGDHGITVVSTREGLEFSTDLRTDAAPLNHLVAAVLEAAPDARCFRDPTRGGLASALNEIAGASGVSITVDETRFPCASRSLGACEMLGYDVFQVANEGKMVAVVPAEQRRGGARGDAPRAVRRGCCDHRRGAEGCGHRLRAHRFGATRIMDMLVGEQLPRIC